MKTLINGQVPADLHRAFSLSTCDALESLLHTPVYKQMLAVSYHHKGIAFASVQTVNLNDHCFPNPLVI